MPSSIDPTKPEAGLATTASVRANFQTAKDEISALELTDGSLQAGIDANAGDIAANTVAINANAANITLNAGDIAANAAAISTNAGNISNNAAAISANTGDIANNTAAIGNNTAAINTNTGNIATNAQDIVDNAAAIAVNASDILARQLQSEKAQANGYAPLNASALVPLVNMAFTNLQFQGGWDASGGLLPAAPVAGDFWIITTPGNLVVVPADGSSTTPVSTPMVAGDYLLFANDGFFYQSQPTFAQFDIRYLQLTGGTLTGAVSGVTPTAVAHLTRKDYVDTGVNNAIGQAQAAQVDADQALLDAAAANNNANTRVLKAGDTLTGNLNGITPTAATHLTRKDYVDGGLGARVLKAGDTLTGQLNGIAPTAVANLTRKDYVDQAIADAIAAIPPPPSSPTFPVGAHLIGFNPNGIFPGTWVQLAEGTFLMNTVGGIDPAGGSNDAAQVSHGHGIVDPGHLHTLADPGHVHAVTDPGHIHGLLIHNDNGANGGRIAWSSSVDNQPSSTETAVTNISVNSNITSMGILDAATGITVAPVGVSPTNRNRPKYVGVAVWQRTA